ncbi:hypothetical protein LHGZ1_1146 [Laribacter hongkongensis]|uniref:Uncharacterized protein n=1 Tax=Laribacter hongkongensis TaxID=168471 RepID=A0A248LGV0_9NEIS|nr:hypothetical protein LHGZ1_1146 [Laribacter hongkongensis]
MYSGLMVSECRSKTPARSGEPAAGQADANRTGMHRESGKCRQAPARKPDCRLDACPSRPA